MAFTAEQKRAYRAARREEGNPVPRGGKSKNKPTKTELGRFLSIDSEGKETADGKHITVLWAAAWKHYLTDDTENESYRWEYDELRDENGVDQKTAIDWLIGLARRNPMHIPVIYGGSYDANMLLNFLPPEKASRLHKKGWVYFKKYKFEFRPRHYLHLARGEEDEKGKWKSTESIRIYDVIGLFQSSFLVALQQTFRDGYEDLKIISDGKDKRDSFSDETLEYILTYTRAELRGLVRLMEEMKKGFLSADIKPKSWDGAGRAASALLSREKVKEHLGISVIENNVPLWNAQLSAYFGGRVEMLRYGNANGKGENNPIYNYDINSAYPAAMVDLPSFTHGKWVYRKNPTLTNTGRFCVYHVLWEWYAVPHGTIYPFPWRSDGSLPDAPKGSIWYPHRGIGWYWRPEVEAAIIGGEKLSATGNNTTLLESWEWVPEGEEVYPFAWIKDIYLTRQAADRAGEKMKSKALKLAYNSCYGKLAQTIGASEKEDENGELKFRPPPYTNMAWAGWITSATRAKMYRAAMQAPDSVIALATDGIWSTEPLGLDVSSTKELGKWDMKTLEDFIILQSGVYFYRLPDKPWSFMSRGISRPNALSDEYQPWIDQQVERVLEAWKQGKEVIEFDANRFITVGTALAGEESFKKWCTWIRDKKQIKLIPMGKRAFFGQDRRAHRRLLSTSASSPWVMRSEAHESMPYSPKWAREMRLANGDDFDEYL